MSVTAPYDCFLESYLVRVEGAGRELQHALGAIKEVLDHFEPPPILEGRLKTPTSTYLKMLRDGLDFDEVHDLLGIRVILPHESLCVPVLESCQKRWPGHRIDFRRDGPSGMLWLLGSNSETLTMRESDLLKILDVLYDTALERGSWTSVLQALADPVDGVTGHLLLDNREEGTAGRVSAQCMA